MVKSFIYVRIERDGKWESVDLFSLTGEERTRLFNDFDKQKLVIWLNDMVVNWKLEARRAEAAERRQK